MPHLAAICSRVVGVRGSSQLEPAPSVPPTWSAMRQNCRVQVTVVMPRRNFAPLRDGTAGQIADVLGQVPDVAVTIIPLSRAAPRSRGHSEPS